MANLTLRSVKGSALTIAEMDGNFEYFTGSYTNTGTITATGFVGDVTGSVSGSVIGNADTATTASYVAGANVDGAVALATDSDLAATASYVAGADVDGDVTGATTAYNLDAQGGDAVLPNAIPGSPTTGSIYFDSAALAFYIYDGSTWLTGSLS